MLRFFVCLSSVFFHHLKAIKILRKTQESERWIFFSFISIASVVVHGWVCGMCEDEMTKQRVKLQKHAYRTSIVAAAVAWCST